MHACFLLEEFRCFIFPLPCFPPSLQVGAKSRNIAFLHTASSGGSGSGLPPWIRSPASVALPFGSFEATLADPSNAVRRGEEGGGGGGRGVRGGCGCMRSWM